jgi:hypothetical protein
LLKFWLCIVCTAAAQFPTDSKPISNLRQKYFRVATDSIKLDSLSIVPNSISVFDVPSTDYKIDYINAVLHWNKKPSIDSLLISYRVFSTKLNRVAFRMRFDSLVNYTVPFVSNDEFYNQQQGGAFSFGNIKAEGSFGRQLAFGNAQDAVLNSSFNLQLAGMLGDSINLAAAITDNNIPIQPDGTTQQLNEFDQVYIRFSKKGWQLNLGDIDIRQNQSQSYFLNFYKRLQGIAFQNTSAISKNAISNTLVSGSIAKGKFTRNILDALEGNQGPYRLRGANNEFFFIVLPNTERVFIDGQLLQRGEDQDYVINYNTAEVTFTPKRMITKDSRIQVEFEYADRNFLNANLYASQEFVLNNRLNLKVGFFNNSDAKNSSINQVLDNSQKQFLSSIGDSIQQAFYPSAVIDTFAAGKILYEKIIVTPGVDSFYQYSTNPSLAQYSLTFIDVGVGKGNYIPEFNGANGKVYKYVAPIGNVRQGLYEPVTLLITPKKQQMMNLGLDYTISKTTKLKTEVAVSNYDANTFSGKDNGDDKGLGAKIQLLNDKTFTNARQLNLSTRLDYEFVQKKFRPLERLRGVEFSRDWGLPLFLNPADEHIIRASAGLKDKNNHSFTYNLISYNRSDNYDGLMQTANHVLNVKGWQLNNQVSFTNFNGAADKGTVFRPVIDISKQLTKISNWRLGMRYALEENKPKYKQTDTLTPLTFSFDIISAYLKSAESKKNKYAVTFFSRSDKYPIGKQLYRGDRSYNLNLQTELLSNDKRQFFLNTTFRKLKVIDNKVSKQKEDETILGRAEYVMNEWKGLLAGNILYELGTGQEQRRDFIYLEVPAGTGQFAWIDYNNNGVQELNEFEFAAFPDQAKFIRLLTPTNEYIKANYITFNYSININPRAVLTAGDLKGMKKFLSKLNIQSSLQINKKAISSGQFQFNPFKFDVGDTALISLSNVFLNTISFNRYSSKWGVDFTNRRNNSQTLLTYGYESRRLNDWIIKWRWNLSSSISFDIAGIKGLNALYTPKFNNRNYEIDILTAEPRLAFIRKTNFRLQVSYKYDSKKNLPGYGGEKSTSHSLNTEMKYSILQNSSITTKFTLDQISYNSIPNTTVSYIMLNGLLPGSNYIWNVTLTKRLLNNLELNVQYDGRKPGSSRTVHVGRAGVTALF